MTTSALQLSTSVGAIASSSSATIPAAAVSSSPVRLGQMNFMLWSGLTLPNLSGAHLHGYLDGSMPAPAKTITEGTGDDAKTVSNPEYTRWWGQDQKVLGLLLSSMEEDIACQLIGCKTAAAVWAAVHTMFGAQTRANVRHIRRQLQSMRKGDMSAATYMHKMKGLADIMATAGTPITDDELVDYIITGLGRDYNSIAGALTVGNVSVTYADFYSHVLSFEALQAEQSEIEDWSSSANAAYRPGQFGGGGFPGQQRGTPAGFIPAPAGAGRPPPGYSQHGQGGGGGGNRQHHGSAGGYGGQPNYGGLNSRGGGYGRPNYGNNGGGNRQNNGRNGRRQRPQCQICNYWGHTTSECRNRYNPDYARAENQRSGNAASTSSQAPPPWLMDTGATDHLTSDLARLHMQERYGGTDQVQVANGVGQGYTENSSSR